jgi:hypothetical protein
MLKTIKDKIFQEKQHQLGDFLPPLNMLGFFADFCACRG